VDRLSRVQRSRLMSLVRSKNTGPEITVRKAVHRLGLRFRLHRRDLPGTPDLVFPKYRMVLFVHGCFWHRHSGCAKSSTPKSRKNYWAAKFNANVSRDRRSIAQLRKLKWKTVVIWECEAKNAPRLEAVIRKSFRLPTRRSRKTSKSPPQRVPHRI
jgi:DNA mismatch endonuclease (patch repair protein)